MNAQQPRRDVFEALLRTAHSNPDAPPALRWNWLEAAHVVGQPDFRLHLRSHQAMLGLAWHTRDLREAAGQVFRLVLVPLGHLLNRLPAGNTGRSRISAFRPMPVRPEIRRLIEVARATASPSPKT
ncbi:MAG TPA: DUF3703 domain-containing protein [Burkholderiaceae bacterium]|nr:DUF3703 domain-containing protein [Burkholderiaceae bacterium]